MISKWNFAYWFIKKGKIKMSDFNKGDFTQQGVDGHVRATLRLNEKRYVELDLTTNENARGCTISGNVHDRLNNLDYPIGGGGVELRKCALTIVNETSLNKSPSDLGFTFFTIEDNMIHVDLPLEHINPHESATYDVIYQFYYEDPTVTPLVPIVSICGMTGNYTYEASNAINCKTDEYGNLTATNPALDSSVTITVSEV